MHHIQRQEREKERERKDVKKKRVEIIIDLGERKKKREMKRGKKRFYKIQNFLFSTTLHSQKERKNHSFFNLACLVLCSRFEEKKRVKKREKENPI